MKCKDIHNKILNDDVLSSEEKHHVFHCISCLTMYEKKQNIDDDLKSLFSAKDYDKKLNKVIRYRNKGYFKPLMIAALIMFSIVIFNDKIISFAEEIPLIKGLIEYITNDETVEILESEGIEFYDYKIPKEAYTLYIKDLLLTDSRLSFKFSVTHHEEVLSNYNWVISFGDGALTHRRMDYNSDPWHDVDMNVTHDAEDKLRITLEHELENIMFDNIELGIEPMVVEPETTDKAVYFEDDISTIRVHHMEVTMTDIILNFTIDHKENIDDFSYLSMYLLDDQENRYELSGIATQDDKSIELSFQPSIYYRDIEELYVVMDNRRYIEIEPISSEPVNLNGFSAVHDKYIGGYEFEKLHLTVEEDKLYIHSPKPIYDTQYPRLLLKVDGYWDEAPMKPFIEDDYEFDVTVEELLVFLNMNDKGIALEDNRLIILEAPSDPAEILTLTKKQLTDFISEHSFMMSEYDIERLINQTKDYQLTLGELEKIIEAKMVDIHEDSFAMQKAAETYQAHLNEYAELDYSIENVKNLMIELMNRKTMHLGSDPQIKYTTGIYSFYNVDLNQHYQVGIVKHVRWTEEQVKIPLNIKD